MKKLLSIATLTVCCALADPLPIIPDLSHDSVTICACSPGLGVDIFATSNTTWSFYFNDNWGNSAPGVGVGDFDFNDAVGKLTFGPVHHGNVLETLNYQVSDTSDDNDVKLLGLPGAWLEVGQTETRFVSADSLVTISMKDETTGAVYKTGAPSVNPDGSVHALVLEQVSGVPEPSSWLLIGTGLVVMGAWRKKKV